MKYPQMKRYIDAAVEQDMASLAGRRALVSADEVVRLGELVFTGPAAERLQLAVDHVVHTAVRSALGVKPSSNFSADLDVDRAFTPGVAIALRAYTEALAAAIGARAAKHRASRATTVGPTLATYRGVWKPDAEYSRGSVVTLDGAFWYAETEPG